VRSDRLCTEIALKTSRWIRLAQASLAVGLNFSEPPPS
jgi:hypothetical protein